MSTQEGPYPVMRTSKVRCNYFFHGSRSQQYIQVGNAVLPYLSYQIARGVWKILGLSRTNRKKSPASSLSAFRSKARAPARQLPLAAFEDRMTHSAEFAIVLVVALMSGMRPPSFF